jgi:hypothetical protein
MKSMLILGTAIGALSLAAGASAQDEGGRTFSQLDRNQDSLVSVSEAQADEGVRSSFAKADINGDGFVSRGEFSTWRSGSGADARPATPVPAGATRPGPQNNPEIDAPPAR